MGSDGSWALKYVFRALLAIVVLFLFVLPALTGMMLERSQTLPKDFLVYIDFIETVQSYLMIGLTALWVFFVGSCFASFLNVVAWRIPRGRSIVGSSACPGCDKKLSLTDNIPIAGWLRTGGECRYCKVPISPRYLVVELILGAVFLLIVIAELVSGGMSIPMRSPSSAGLEWVLYEPKWGLIQITCFHLTLISTVFTLALVELEKTEQPWLITLPFALTGFVCAIALPPALPVGWELPAPAFVAYSHTDAGLYLTPLFGLMCGVLCGGIVVSTGRSDLKNNGNWKHIVFSLALCGLFLGWQASISVCLIFLILRCLVPVFPPRLRMYANVESGLVCAAAIVHILFWRATAATSYWPGPLSEWWQVLIGLIACIAIGRASAQLNSTAAGKEVVQTESSG
ncbi:MAG: prepilin peptidase [Planctomycetota bacterium]